MGESTLDSPWPSLALGPWQVPLSLPLLSRPFRQVKPAGDVAEAVGAAVDVGEGVGAAEDVVDVVADEIGGAEEEIDDTGGSRLQAAAHALDQS